MLKIIGNFKITYFPISAQLKLELIFENLAVNVKCDLLN